MRLTLLAFENCLDDVLLMLSTKNRYFRPYVVWGCFICSYDYGVCWLVDIEDIPCASCIVTDQSS